jgi:DNA mismatch repair protein MutL
MRRFEGEKTDNWQKLYPDENRKEFPGHEEKLSETLRRFFQLKNKYIACPVKSGFMLIDQKRAHERILYEKYIKFLHNKKPASQTDLFPVTVELNPADLYVLKEIEQDLQLLGFRFEHNGGSELVISGLPSESGISDPVAMLETMIEKYKETQGDPSSAAAEKVAAAMSEASAIPYGKVLSQKEMEIFFDTLFACASPNYSPAGKLIISIISLEEIDKRFK